MNKLHLAWCPIRSQSTLFSFGISWPAIDSYFTKITKKAIRDYPNCWIKEVDAWMYVVQNAISATGIKACTQTLFRPKQKSSRKTFCLLSRAIQNNGMQKLLRWRFLNLPYFLFEESVGVESCHFHWAIPHRIAFCWIVTRFSFSCVSCSPSEFIVFWSREGVIKMAS